MRGHPATRPAQQAPGGAPDDRHLALDQLEKRNLVKRTPHPTDRRAILATLTPAGQELLEQATEALADNDFGLAGVSRELSHDVVGILADVRERIGCS